MIENTSVQQQGISFPDVVERPVSWENHSNIHQADKYKAIVDIDTGKLFFIVRKDYRLIRHEEAIEQLEIAMEGVSDLGKYETYTYFYNYGGRMRRTYRFSDISVDIGLNDPVNLELHLFNSYDITWPFIVFLGAFRVICTNGLVVMKALFQVRRRHVFDLEQVNLEEEISTALRRFSLQTEEWKEWANRQLTENTYSKVMEAMKFGKKATEEIERQVDKETREYGDDGFPILSIWIFFNVLTWYITHRAVSLNHRVEMERKLRGAMARLRGK